MVLPSRRTVRAKRLLMGSPVERGERRAGRADVGQGLGFGDAHGYKMLPLSSFVKGIHVRRRKKIFVPSCPFLYACAMSSVVVFTTPRTVYSHGRGDANIS